MCSGKLVDVVTADVRRRCVGMFEVQGDDLGAMGAVCGINEIMLKIAVWLAEEGYYPTIGSKGSQKRVVIFEVEFAATLKQAMQFQRLDGFYAVDAGATDEKIGMAEMTKKDDVAQIKRILHIAGQRQGQDAIADAPG